ncbi:hypothetical protein [Thalassospira australica]|uniref:hypothetical protein n=1 Tax=Thalassospira australica TaxID=1528106 RepID=UPI00051A021B|nr:hypothetical protein [Thalassospira australica]
MTHTPHRLIIAFALFAVLPGAAIADTDPNLKSYEADMQTGEKSWRAQKCAVYQETRTDMLETIPRGALSPEFAKAEEDYIANGCSGRAYACPETKTELKYANQMSLAMMSHGLSGTFLPYGCKSSIQ